MLTERDNTVPAGNQITANAPMRGEGDGHPRVLFLGNSITLHGPKPEIGWKGDWGMAASREACDYVHVFMEAFREEHPSASWRVGQLAEWERNFWKDEAVLSPFSPLRDWRADYVFSVILGANTPPEALDAHDYAAHNETMLRYFDPTGRAKVIATTMFWRSDAKDAAVRRAAHSLGAACVELGGLGDMKEMMALERFEHRGVAMHPGDPGMRAIAERLLAAAKG